MSVDIFKKIKEARKLLKLSQSEFALKLSVPQKDISLTEGGHKQFIPNKYILFLSENNVDINTLYSDQKVDFIKKTKTTEKTNVLNVSKNVSKNVLNQNNNNTLTNKDCKLKESSQTTVKEPTPLNIEATGNANVMLLNASAAASDFTQALTNPVYTNELQTLCLPKFMHRKGTFYAVSITGDSMHPTIKENDIVAGSLEPLLEFVGGLPYVFFHKSKGLMVKRFHWDNKEHGELRLTSDNEYIDDFFARVNEIQPHIIKVETVISTNTHNWNTDMRNDVKDLKKAIADIQIKINRS